MQNRLYALEFEKPLRDLDRQLEQLHQLSIENNVDVSSEIAAIERKIEATKRAIYNNLTPWQRVQIARHPKRPFTLDYVKKLFTDFQEFHGDRLYRDDRSMVGGPARFEGQTGHDHRPAERPGHEGEPACAISECLTRRVTARPCA